MMQQGIYKSSEFPYPSWIVSKQINQPRFPAPCLYPSYSCCFYVCQVAWSITVFLVLIDLGLRNSLSISKTRKIGLRVFPLSPTKLVLVGISQTSIFQSIFLLPLFVSFELMWILTKSEYGIKWYLHWRTRRVILDKLQHLLSQSALYMGSLYNQIKSSVLLHGPLENSIHAVSHLTDNNI